MQTIYGVATYHRAGTGFVRGRLQHYSEPKVARFVARGMAHGQKGVMVFRVTGAGDVWSEPEVLNSYGDCPAKPI